MPILECKISLPEIKEILVVPIILCNFEQFSVRDKLDHFRCFISFFQIQKTTFIKNLRKFI
ncbi:hypothetical protein JCM12298_05580 [Desulfothermus naphthae]